MTGEKPSLPKGTQDFGPEKMANRNYIFETIKATFQKYSFLPLETPSVENLSVLMNKYGSESDQMIFKILNSGDFLSKVDTNDIKNGFESLSHKISDKALRYDLTVPFARYVVMNRNTLTFPFKRYQIQPVWRAERPQKSRYREFYQCDADMIGTNSLICEAEIILMIDEILKRLGITDFTIKLNHRQILSGLFEILGGQEQEADLFIALDKRDKIGTEEVLSDLEAKGFSKEFIKGLMPFFELSGKNDEKISFLKKYFSNSGQGMLGVRELEEVFALLENFNFGSEQVELDVCLARGISYYTGAIFEVKTGSVTTGSISGGGRYDNLTGVFGLPGISGVGISFGVDRIYDLMETLSLFRTMPVSSTKVMICNLDKESEKSCLPFLAKLRTNDINSEIYPDQSKLKKQLAYANKKSIPFVIMAGQNERAAGKLTLKNMETGDQKQLSEEEMLAAIEKKLDK